jgi:hypothetical protein
MAKAEGDAWTSQNAELAACKTLACDQKRACSCSSTVRLASGPKRSMGHVLGGEKGIFLIRGRGRPTVYGGRAGGILSMPAREVSPSSPRLGTIHVQAPTPHAPPLPAYFGLFSHHCGSLNHELLGNGLQSSRPPKNRRMRYRRLPTTRPTPRGIQEPICHHKKCVIWARRRPVPVKNVNFSRTPGIVLAVSSDPILPHR